MIHRYPVAVLALAWLALCLPLHARAAPPVHDTMAQRMQACVVCHGKEGRATNEGYFPRIAGKPQGYLYNQLENFRTGRRVSPTMSWLVEHLSDDYLREIAGYFSALDLPYPQPPALSASPPLLARGETLVRHGDAAHDIPSCADCHGARMTGIEPAVPGLLGLPQDYVTAQLGAWKSGARRAHAPDCMADIARRLPGEDVVAVAAWLAAQPLPADPTPLAVRPDVAPPLDCGSGFE